MLEAAESAKNLSLENSDKIKNMKNELDKIDKDFNDKVDDFKNTVQQSKVKIQKQIKSNKALAMSLKSSTEDVLKIICKENLKSFDNVDNKLNSVNKKIETIYDVIYKKSPHASNKVKLKGGEEKRQFKRIESEIKHLKAETRKSFFKLDQSLKERAKSVDYTSHKRDGY